MKLIICESYPGEISDGCPHDISNRLEKAIGGARKTVRSVLPDLPGDGEVKALRELSDLMEARWSEHMKGLTKVVLEKVNGE